MLPSIYCERGHLTRNSCFKDSRWHHAHKPLLPLCPLSLVGSGWGRGDRGIAASGHVWPQLGSIQTSPRRVSFTHSHQFPESESSQAKQDLGTYDWVRRQSIEHIYVPCVFHEVGVQKEPKHKHSFIFLFSNPRTLGGFPSLCPFSFFCG